jgi:hypothetical protein
MAVVPYNFQLFPGRYVTSNDVLEAYHVEYNPIHSVVRNAPIEIIIPRQHDCVINLKQCSLWAEVKITNENNEDVGDNLAAPCNNILHSIWKTVTVHLNGTNVSGANEHYHYRAYLEDLMSYTPEAHSYQLQMQGWYGDTVGQIASTNLEGENIGLAKRAILFNDHRSVKLCGRIHADVFNIDQVLLPFTEMKVTLTPNQDNVVLITAAPAGNAAQVNYRLKINKVHLRAHQYRLHPEAREELLRYLQHNNLPYEIKHAKVNPITIPPNINEHTALINVGGAIPSRILIGFVNQNSFSGNYQSNPYNFQAFNVSGICLKSNGRSIPSTGAININYANRDCVEAYYQLYEALGLIPPIKPHSISLEGFRQGFALYAFDLTRHHNSSSIDIAPEVAPIDLVIKFTAPPQEAIYAIIYSEQRKAFHIDSTFNVINPL